MSSFEDIDYRLRPAKQTERRMIADALGCLVRLGTMDRYQYIGLGSISFLDFTLVHRVLGINDMISMEDPKNFDRVEFNAPFRCITVKKGRSNAVLPSLKLEKPAIVWMDYDGKISLPILEDISLLATKLVPGSVMLVTLNCHVSKKPPTPQQLADEAGRVEAAIDRRRMPNGFKNSMLQGWGYAKFLHLLCTQEIQKALVERNRLIKNSAAPTPENDERVNLKQFLNFGYSDGANMCTFAWFVDYSSPNRSQWSRADFGTIPFMRTGVDPFVIKPPILTPKEIRHLNAQIPEQGVNAKSPGISEDAVRDYVKVYRHFPSYFEVAEI